MSQRRLARIARLVTIRERERDVAQAMLAEARRATEQAQRAVEEAIRRWEEEAARLDSEPDRPVSEFALGRMHLRSLQHEIERARAHLRSAMEHEAKALETTTAAQRELRKMEVWRENETERVRLEEQRRDQNLTDEFAARIVQNASSQLDSDRAVEKP